MLVNGSIIYCISSVLARNVYKQRHENYVYISDLIENATKILYSLQQWKLKLNKILVFNWKLKIGKMNRKSMKI